MSRCLDEQALLDFVEGRHPPAAGDAYEAHVADCARCGELLATVAEAWFPDGASVPALPPGARVGRYEVLAHAGTGGMGEVYRARDTRLGRAVALKVLPLEQQLDPKRLRRFRREAEAAARINHPSVVTLYDAGVHEGVPFLVCEWLEGETLRQRLGRGSVPSVVALGWALSLARGLGAAHHAGVVHRDLKPENVWLLGDGRLKILDFGLAKQRQLPSLDGTSPGTMLGTIGYTAPEQVRGEPVDGRSDLFALGAMLYEALSGELAFPGPGPVERLHAVLHHEPAPLTDPVLGPIVARCLAKEPGARFTSAAELVQLIEPLLPADEAARAEAHGGNGVTHDAPSPVLTLVPTLPRRRSLTPRSTPRRLTPRSTPLGPAPVTALPARAPLPLPSTPPRPATLPVAAAPRRRLGRVLGLGLFAAALAAGGFALARALTRPAPEPYAYRVLTIGRGRVSNARFLDSASVVYGAAWEGAPIRLFATRLDHVAPRLLQPGSTDVLAVSRRGDLLLALEPRKLDGFDSSGTLATAPVEGGAPRPLRDDVQEADWLPDGNVALVRREGAHYQLELPAGQVVYRTGGWLSHARVAPDGHSVAVLDHPTPEDDRGRVLLVEPGGRWRVLSDGWVSVNGLAWAPGGERLWMTAAPLGGDNALYSVGRDGQPARLEARVPGRLVVYDAAADGRLLVAHESLRARTRLKSAGESVSHEVPGDDAAVVADLSRDGRQLLYAVMSAAEGDLYASYLRREDGASVRLGDGFPLALSPDGRAALAVHMRTPPELVLLPIGAGTPRRVPTPDWAAIRTARWFPDGKRVLLAAHQSGHGPRLWLLDLTSSAPPRPLSDEDQLPSAAIAPDGGRIAGIDAAGRLLLIPVAGGAPTVYAGRFPDRVVAQWSADGRDLLLRRRGLPLALESLDLSSGAITAEHDAPTPSDAGAAGPLNFVITPDGHAWAYTFGEVLSRLYLAEPSP